MSLLKIVAAGALASPLLMGCSSSTPPAATPAAVNPIPKVGAPAGAPGMPPAGMAPQAGMVPGGAPVAPGGMPATPSDAPVVPR